MGIDIEIERHIGVRNYPTKAEILQDYYLCKPKDSEPLVISEPSEVAKIKWVPAQESLGYFTSDVATEVVEVLKEIQKEEISNKGTREKIH